MSHIKRITLNAEQLLADIEDIPEPQSGAEKAYAERLTAALAKLAGGAKPKKSAGRKPAKASERG